MLGSGGCGGPMGKLASNVLVGRERGVGVGVLELWL